MKILAHSACGFSACVSSERRRPYKNTSLLRRDRTARFCYVAIHPWPSESRLPPRKQDFRGARYEANWQLRGQLPEASRRFVSIAKAILMSGETMEKAKSTRWAFNKARRAHYQDSGVSEPSVTSINARPFAHTHADARHVIKMRQWRTHLHPPVFRF